MFPEMALEPEAKEALMKRIVPILAVVVLAAVSVAAAQGGPGRHATGPGPMMGGQGPHMGGPGGPGGVPFGEYLFPPELVLRNQIKIGLTEDQTASIKRLIADAHTRTIDLRVDLERATERLGGVLQTARVDEAAALAAAEQAMTLESQIKRTHLTLLIRVKNLLTEEQQAQLDRIRPQRGPGAGGPPDVEP